MGGLGGALAGEMAKDAGTAWAKVFAGKAEASHKALSPIKAIRLKLGGLSFAEPAAAPSVDLMDEALSKTPRRGAHRRKLSPASPRPGLGLGGSRGPARAWAESP